LSNGICRNHNIFYVIDCSYLFNQQISKMTGETKENLLLAVVILALAGVVVYSLVTFIIQ